MYLRIILEGLSSIQSCGMIINHLLIDETFFTMLLLSMDFKVFIKFSFDNKLLELQQTLLTILLTASKKDGIYLTNDYINEFLPLLKGPSPLFTM